MKKNSNCLDIFLLYVTQMSFYQFSVLDIGLSFEVLDIDLYVGEFPRTRKEMSLKTVGKMST